MRWRKLSNQPDNIDNWTCSDNIDIKYNTCTDPDQYDLEIGKKSSSIDLTHGTPSSNTSTTLPVTRSFRYSLRPGTRRDYRKLAHLTASKVLLQQALPPTTPLHVGAALKDKLRHH